MSESGQESGWPMKTKLAGAVLAAGAIIGLAREGLLNDLPKDVSQSYETENANQDLIGKPIINGQAINEDGELKNISGAIINPRTQEVEVQPYQIRINEGTTQNRAYKRPDTNGESVDLSEIGIDSNKTLNAIPVHGEVYGDKNNPDNILGNSEPVKGVHTGSYLKIISDDERKIDIYVPLTTAVVLNPIQIPSLNQ